MNLLFRGSALVLTCFFVALTGAVMLSGGGAGALAADSPQAAPARRVIACYFHRTQRCPTCLKIGSYVEEAVKTGFEKEIAEGRVVLTMVDFQDPKNQKLTDAYKITGPALVVIHADGNKAAAWKPAPKVWSLVGKKAEFLKYVQDEVRGYLEKQQ
jgi:hypothetical protein